MSPFSSFLNHPERSRIITPPPEETHEQQDLFTKYMNQIKHPAVSPRFNHSPLTPCKNRAHKEPVSSEKKAGTIMPNKAKNCQNQDLNSCATIISGVLSPAMIEASLENYSLNKVLGLGAYAVVRLAVSRQNNTKYAIKTYEKAKLVDHQKRKNVTREIKILSKLRHPNIVKLVSACETETQLNLVMEYTTANSLNTYLKTRTNRRLCEDEVAPLHTHSS